MQIIIILLCLFVIGCVLYGIASGVQIIQRCFSLLANSRNDDKASTAKSASVILTTAEPDNAKSRIQKYHYSTKVFANYANSLRCSSWAH